MNIDGKEYEFIRASDAIRDGMALECFEVGSTTAPVLEAYYYDSTGRFTFTAFAKNLPFELVEEFLRAARRGLPPKPG